MSKPSSNSNQGNKGNGNKGAQGTDKTAGSRASYGDMPTPGPKPKK